MNDEPVGNTDTKPIKEKSSEDVLFDTLGKLSIWLLITPIASIIIGIAMIMWYDLIGDFWKNSGKGIVLWLFWSRPVGVLFLSLGLIGIWQSNFSDSKTDKTE
jgi:hypothetical protein